MDNSKANPRQRSRHFIGRPPVNFPNPMRFQDDDEYIIGDRIPDEARGSSSNIDEDESTTSANSGQSSERTQE